MNKLYLTAGMLLLCAGNHTKSSDQQQIQQSEQEKVEKKVRKIKQNYINNLHQLGFWQDQETGYWVQRLGSEKDIPNIQPQDFNGIGMSLLGQAIQHMQMASKAKNIIGLHNASKVCCNATKNFKMLLLFLVWMNYLMKIKLWSNVQNAYKSS